MGMGTFACHDTIIDEKDILQLPTAGPALTTLRDLMSNYDMSDDIFAHAGCESDFAQEIAAYIDDDELQEEFIDTLQAVCDGFKADTELGLDVNYHDVDNDGDRYDEVDGIYWSVSNVWQLTPAAEKMKDKLQNVSFTKYG